MRILLSLLGLLALCSQAPAQGCTGYRVGQRFHDARAARLDARAAYHATMASRGSSCQGYVAGSYQFVPYAASGGCTSSQAGTRQSGCNGGSGAGIGVQVAPKTTQKGPGAYYAPMPRSAHEATMMSPCPDCQCSGCNCGPNCPCNKQDRATVQRPQRAIY